MPLFQLASVCNWLNTYEAAQKKVTRVCRNATCSVVELQVGRLQNFVGFLFICMCSAGNYRQSQQAVSGHNYFLPLILSWSVQRRDICYINMSFRAHCFQYIGLFLQGQTVKAACRSLGEVRCFTVRTWKQLRGTMSTILFNSVNLSPLNVVRNNAAAVLSLCHTLEDIHCETSACNSW